MGSVNLKADEETNKYETEIKNGTRSEGFGYGNFKTQESINELNQKVRTSREEKLTEIEEAYTKLFNGGSAKLELVDSDDHLSWFGN